MGKLTALEVENLPRVRISKSQKAAIVKITKLMKVKKPETAQYEVSIKIMALGLKVYRETHG